ncbi:MAG: hypothetical protein J0H43_06125 [Actinobacteria bacterium]|nr:hypothetical protein [Actinomycetota bacterium]
MLAVTARGLAPGSVREVAALRMRLQDELQNTTHVQDQTSATDVATVQLAPVLAGLQRTAAAMDTDLAKLQSDSNRDRRHRELERYRPDVETLIGAATRLRDTAARTAAISRETELSAIAAQVDEQVSYLDTYQQNYRRQYQHNELDLDDHGSDGDADAPGGGPRA